MSSRNALPFDIAIERRATWVFDCVQRQVHPRALVELIKYPEIIKHLMQWIRHRFEALELDQKDRISLDLNPLNTDGLGLQVVTLCVRRPRRLRILLDPKNRLLQDELEDPTIEIVTSGLLNGSPRSCIVDLVNVAENQVHRVTPLSSNFMIGQGNSSITKTTPMPQIAEPGKAFSIKCPYSLRTVMELRDPPYEDWVRDTSNQGVYVREVLKAAKT